MHYCLLILTKDFPSNDKLYEVLEPFRDFSDCNPNRAIQWDFWTVGGRVACRPEKGFVKSVVVA